MSKRDILLLLQDMYEAATKIKNYSAGYSYERFLNDEKTIDAVVRNFEIIGEAANRIDDAFKFDFPQIEWNKLRGFRNRLIHEYFGVDIEIVWTIIEEDIDTLIDRLEEIISTLK